MNRFEYNGLDCCTTFEANTVLHKELDDYSRRAYEAEKGVQEAFLVVGARGIRVDKQAAGEMQKDYEAEIAAMGTRLNERAGRELTGPKGMPVPQRLTKYFYAEGLGLRPVKNKDGSVTTDRDALDKIRNRKITTLPSVPQGEKSARLDEAKGQAQLILDMREMGKDLGVLRACQHEDRMYTSFKMGPETFRAASSQDHRSRGTNLQNQKKEMRRIYIPDPGWVMFQADQERAESLTVAHLAADEAYIEAHEGDTHVRVARLLFPDRPWTGDEEKDKAIAKAEKVWTPLHGEKDLRDLAKRTQHGLNYMLSPHGLARHAGIPVALAKEVYARYHGAFPGIKEWHREVIEQVKKYGILYYPGGYKRQFFGRTWDESTWKEAVASVPQSIVAWTNHIAFVRCVRAEREKPLQVLAHGHDAVIGQVREGQTVDLGPLLEVTWTINGRQMTIPWEIKWGENWYKVS